MQLLLEVGKVPSGIVEAEVIDRDPVARSPLGKEANSSYIFDVDEGHRVLIFARDLCLGVVGHDPCIPLCGSASLLDVLCGSLEDIYAESEALHLLHHAGIAYLASFFGPLLYVDVATLQTEGRV